jgi:hypothetical protein
MGELADDARKKGVRADGLAFGAPHSALNMPRDTARRKQI